MVITDVLTSLNKFGTMKQSKCGIFSLTYTHIRIQSCNKHVCICVHAVPVLKDQVPQESLTSECFDMMALWKKLKCVALNNER